MFSNSFHRSRPLYRIDCSSTALFFWVAAGCGGGAYAWHFPFLGLCALGCAALALAFGAVEGFYLGPVRRTLRTRRVTARTILPEPAHVPVVVIIERQPRRAREPALNGTTGLAAPAAQNGHHRMAPVMHLQERRRPSVTGPEDPFRDRGKP